jgi:hypothetical protein
MKYFNNIIIFTERNNQILFRKPTFNEVYQSIISGLDKNVITESVYKTEIFQELFNNITNAGKQIQLFTTEKLKEYFPIKSKVFKILCKNRNQNNYKLYVICDTYNSKEQVKNVLMNVCADDKFDEEDVELIYYKLKHAFAMFSMLKNSKEFGILWLKPTNKIYEFAHEFVHYLEFINGFYGNDINVNFNDNVKLFENEDEFKSIFNLSPEDLHYIFSKEEYQTLLNDFLINLQRLKQKYFVNQTDFQFARYISYHLFRDNESIIDYLNKIKNFDYFNELNTEYDFAMIVGYNCLNFKIMNIKNHIFGKFGNKR